MKSIREWRSERSTNFNEANLINAVRNMVGSSSVKTDPSIKAGLRSRVIGLWKDAKDNGMSPREFLNQVWAVVGSLLFRKSGSNVNVGAVGRGLSAEPQQAEWENLSKAILSEMDHDGHDMTRAQFTGVMGGSTVDVDPKIRSKLRAKISEIQKDEDFRDKSEEDLLRDIMAVVSSLLAGKTGSSMSTSGVFGSLSKDSERIANIG